LFHCTRGTETKKRKIEPKKRIKHTKNGKGIATSRPFCVHCPRKSENLTLKKNQGNLLNFPGYIAKKLRFSVKLSKKKLFSFTPTGTPSVSIQSVFEHFFRTMVLLELKPTRLVAQLATCAIKISVTENGDIKNLLRASRFLLWFRYRN